MYSTNVVAILRRVLINITYNWFNLKDGEEIRMLTNIHEFNYHLCDN